MTPANPLDEQVLASFRTRLDGTLLEPGDDGYEEARSVWNGMIDKHPALIARCASVEDVVASVNLAREHGLELAVKAGGHNGAGRAVCDDGLVIDVSPMNAVDVDPEARRVRVEAGALGGDLDEATQAHGLATTFGTDSRTGVAGLTLGGGLGYLARKHGLAADNVVAMDVVTADGAFRRASARENPNLFWGLRGGGGNLGVVTAFEFQLHELGPEVLTAQVFFPHEQLAEALRFYRDVHARGPDEVSLLAAILTVPPMDPFPEEQHGRTAIAIAGCYAGPMEEGREALAPLDELGEPFLKVIEPMPYTELQTLFNASNPDGARYYGKSRFLAELSDEAIDVIVERTRELPGALTAPFMEPMGGAINRVDPEATAFPNRDAAVNFTVFGGHTDASMDDEIKAWVRDFDAAMAPFETGGSYVNYLDTDDGEKVRRAYGPNVERLAELKARYDPGNLLAGNVNVPPSS